VHDTKMKYFETFEPWFTNAKNSLYFTLMISMNYVVSRNCMIVL